jgi:hypothetical protein
VLDTLACAASMWLADKQARSSGPQGNPRRCNCARTLTQPPIAHPCLCS